MKNKLLGIIAGAIIMLGGMGIASAAPATATISFDTYCDGFTVTYDQVTGHASGMRAGTCITPTPAVGSIGLVNGQTAVTIGWTELGSLYSFILYVNNTWELLLSDGLGGQSLVNSGTWTMGAPLALGLQGRPSTQP